MRVRSVICPVMKSMTGKDDKRADGQVQIQQQHRDHDAAQRQNIGGELDKAVGENLIDGLAVVGYATHQVADAMAIVIIHGERLKMPEEGRADIGHKMLAHAYHDDAVDDREDTLRQIDREHYQRKREQAFEVVVHDILVYCPAQQYGTYQSE